MSLDRLAPAIFVFLWSTGWVTAKYAVYYTGPLTFLCLRYLLAGALLWAICRVSSIQWPQRRADVFRAILSGVFLHGLYLGMIWWAIGQAGGDRRYHRRSAAADDGGGRPFHDR